VALGQQEPVVPGVLDQPPTRLDEALLEAGQRPALDAPWQHEPPRNTCRAVSTYTGLSLRNDHVSRQAAHGRVVRRAIDVLQLQLIMFSVLGRWLPRRPMSATSADRLLAN
jgi:hypothetical protein